MWDTLVARVVKEPWPNMGHRRVRIAVNEYPLPENEDAAKAVVRITLPLCLVPSHLRQQLDRFWKPTRVCVLSSTLEEVWYTMVYDLCCLINNRRLEPRDRLHCRLRTSLHLIITFKATFFSPESILRAASDNAGRLGMKSLQVRWSI